MDGLLAEVRAGRSRVLVVGGEPGIGKTALLGYAVDTARDFQTTRAEGVESEMELRGGCHDYPDRRLAAVPRLL